MKFSKKLILLITLIMILMLLFISGCTKDEINQRDNDDSVDGKITVVATLFPQYDFARTIGGDKINVKLILPPGVEPHSYEPTPMDVIQMNKSELFLYTGEDMEPWAFNMIQNLEAEGVLVIDLSKSIELMDSDHEHTEDDSHAKDPHYWTDPNLASVMVEDILQAILNLDSPNANYYTGNADRLKSELSQLDQDIRNAIEKMGSRTILSGGHFAFGYFAHRYGLISMSPYEGFSPNAEPTPKSISELIDTIKETGAKAIFYEELIDPKVARIISEESGAEMLMLHGVHNVSQNELESGKSYVDFMYENLENLKTGLGYND
ncbi:MAG: zinc ABC transporter substrate-binding protein [Gudongella sp.]|jgi:zinc transport system substrate-binding protein|nr:zinc ABC transporter substrate-binding protein [Gudongella sp.]